MGSGCQPAGCNRLSHPPMTAISRPSRVDPTATFIRLVPDPAVRVRPPCSRIRRHLADQSFHRALRVAMNRVGPDQAGDGAVG